MKKYIVLIIAALIFLSGACKKKNENGTPGYADDISGVKIRYVLSIVDAANSVGKSETSGIRNAEVTLVMNDSIFTKKVDNKGIVYFDNLFAGNTIVKVECEGYTTANLVVNLAAKDTLDIYDSDNRRIASTIVTLFPLEGDEVATITGNLYADTDLTIPGMENVNSDLLIRAVISPDQIWDYINHSAPGGILNFAFENASVAGRSEQGSYSLTVPSSLRGLTILINSDNFEANQKVSATEYTRRIFSAQTETVIVYPGSRLIKDLIFNP